MAAPLADKIRPKTLADVVGQEHILAEGKPLRRIIESGNVPNMIFYGPSGVGTSATYSLSRAAATLVETVRTMSSDR